MHMVIPHVLRAKFTSQRFLNQISRLPVPHWIQKSADFDIYIYMYMLAFCCGGPTLRTSQMLTYIIATLTVSTSLPLSTELQEVYFIPRPRNKALAAVKIQNYIYIYVFYLIFLFIYMYINFMQYLSSYINVHMKTIIVTGNHLEHQCFQIVQSLTLEPPSGEFPSTHRRIPVTVRHIWSGTAWEDQQRCVYMRCARIAKQRNQH